MKKVIMVAMMAALASAAIAEDGVSVSMSADLASAYVFRGATFNDGLVLQPGLEIGGLPVTVGVWANFDIDDYDGALADSQFSEIDIYAGYDLGAGFGLGYCEYTYPGAEAEADREISLSYEADLPGAPSISINYGIGGGIDKSLYVELGVSQDVEASEDLTISLAAAVGYADPDEGESGFSHYTVSASTSIGPVGIGLNYVGQIDDDVLPDVEDGGSYDTDFFATIGVSKEF
jgi:uncharacterized protein (TIGR02001 family)